MALKRKRSSSELCSSPSSTSSSSTFGSPPNRGSLMLEVSPAPFFQPAHLPSRTMKRYRDNRPTEEQVHQRTLGLLYSAQQHASLAQHQANPTPDAHIEPPSTARQQGLHRFWNIRTKPSSTAAPTTIAAPLSRCEDCGSGLDLGCGDSMDMDDGSSANACTACGKHVCFSCSVSNLGEQKRCLKCASGNEWVGRSRGAADITMF